MGFTVNKQIIVGNCGFAEHKKINDELTVSNFSVATTHDFKDKQGEWQSKTEWHNCTAFNLSTWHQEAIQKGAKLYVEGRKETEKYEKDGKEQFAVKCKVDVVIPLDKNGNGQKSNKELSDEDF